MTKSELYILLSSIFLFLSLNIFSQKDTTLSFWSPDIEVTDRTFKARYDSVKRRVIKVYPYALHAQNLLFEYQKEIEKLDKKSQIKKFGKKTQQKLKKDFKYIIRQMYISEGKVLMKLIHLETGFTVREIIELYRGKSKAGWYQFVGNMFNQNLSSTYDPNEDWIIEMVLRDIEAGRIKVNPKIKLISKDDYKKIMKNRKKIQKELKEWRKKNQKEKRKKQKEQKKRE